MKKKVIFVIIVILLVIIGIIGYMVVSDLRQEDKLMEEVSEINELANAEDIDIDEINERLDRTVTSGDYAKVEVSFKRYLKNQSAPAGYCLSVPTPPEALSCFPNNARRNCAKDACFAAAGASPNIAANRLSA